jgi:hypothetical protein
VAAAAAVVLVIAVLVPPDDPQPLVARYLRATASGDERAALEVWALYERSVGQGNAIAERRTSTTADLARRRAGARYAITSIEWWRTCCEPGRIDDPHNAGLARVHVTTSDAAGTEHRLIFEVWAKDLVYWGDAAGSPRHEWTLYEVHREDEPCVFPNPTYGCIREFSSAAPAPPVPR